METRIYQCGRDKNDLSPLYSRRAKKRAPYLTSTWCIECRLCKRKRRYATLRGDTLHRIVFASQASKQPVSQPANPAARFLRNATRNADARDVSSSAPRQPTPTTTTTTTKGGRVKGGGGEKRTARPRNSCEESTHRAQPSTTERSRRPTERMLLLLRWLRSAPFHSARGILARGGNIANVC